MLDIWFRSYQEGQMYADMKSLLQLFYMVVKYNVLPWGKNINYKYLKTSLTLHETEFRKWHASSQSRNSACFRTQSSIAMLPTDWTRSYIRRIQSTPTHTSSRPILILSTVLRLDMSSVLILSGFPIKPLYAFRVTSSRFSSIWVLWSYVLKSTNQESLRFVIFAVLLLRLAWV
jgi:hypothetical protein